MRIHPLRRSTVLMVLSAVSAIILVGCGGSGGDDNGSSGKDNGVAAKSASEILAATKAAVVAKKSFHLSGTGMENGETLSVDLSVDTTTKAAQGSFTIKGAKLEVIRIGSTIYIKAPGSFYASNGVPATAAQLLDGKWLKASADNKDFADLAAFADVDSLLEPDGEVSKGEQTTVSGQAVIALVDSKGTNTQGTLYVRTTGDPLPVAIKGGGDSPGTLNFSDFGTEVAPTAPPDAVDLSQLGG